MSAPVKLLLVDDTRANLTALLAVLDVLGHELVTASSGEETLELCASQDFAVILMDVQLPGLDGFETTKRIRASNRNQHVPIVFMSAIHDSLDYAQRGFDLGAIDYIAKPFDMTLLRAKVRALVELHVRGEQLKEQQVIIQREATKDLFIGILGHDLRGPLSAITMAAQLLLEAEDMPPQHLRTLARINNSTQRMKKLIDDVTDFTRGKLGGGIPVVLAEANMREICAALVDELQLANAQRVITLETHGQVTGMWDLPRVAQAVQNLVGNAVKHAKGDVEVRVYGKSDEVLLEVHNLGPPIPADAMERLFEPFYRGDKKGQAGLGLGLYIVKEIAVAHGAKVSVTSTEGEGTTFRIVWPKMKSQH